MRSRFRIIATTSSSLTHSHLAIPASELWAGLGGEVGAVGGLPEEALGVGGHREGGPGGDAARVVPEADPRVAALAPVRPEAVLHPPPPLSSFLLVDAHDLHAVVRHPAAHRQHATDVGAELGGVQAASFIHSFIQSFIRDGGSSGPIKERIHTRAFKNRLAFKGTFLSLRRTSGAAEGR